MADITICTNDFCELKETCYRFKAPRNDHWQWVASYEPKVENGKTVCEMFIKLSN